MTSNDFSIEVPAPVTRAIWSWLAAVGFGVGETLVRVALPDGPSAGDLVTRGAIYLVVVALVLTLRTGSNWVRWTLAFLLGVVGTLSLVIEPVAWLLMGGSPGAFLAGADGATLAIVAFRVLHLLAVFAALVLMFGPRSNRFFSSRTFVV